MSKSIVEQLKQAIQDRPESLHAVSQGAEVDHAAVYRFIQGQRDVTLQTAAKLCRYLRLELAPIPSKRTK